MEVLRLNPNHYIKIRFHIIMEGIIISCGVHSWAFYSVLSMFANWETGYSCPTDKRIHELTGMERNTIRECRRRLKKAGYITYEFRKIKSQDGEEHGRKRYFYHLMYPANQKQ